MLSESFLTKMKEFLELMVKEILIYTKWVWSNISSRNLDKVNKLIGTN